MIKVIESAGDKMLSAIVPKATADAAGCTCSGFWTETYYCYCSACGAGSFGSKYKMDCTCNGCFLACSSCHIDWWSICIC